jgi:hypothetical protein
MDQTDDPIFPDASHMNGTSVVGTTESTGVTEADPPTADLPERSHEGGLRPGFLSELASAMRATAERERETIAARVAEDAAGHVDKVRARAAIETEELRRLAEEDVEHIEEWSRGEMDRIRAEADQKVADRRSSLDDYLKQHDAIIDSEIEGVEAAVAEYGTTLDRFFAELAEAGDPAAIVARAEALPPPPDLDLVRAQARSKAVSVFAESDATPEAEASTDVIAEAAVVNEPAPAEAAAPTEAVADGGSPEAAEFIAPTTDIDGSDGTGDAEAIAETEMTAPITDIESTPVGEDAGEAAAGVEPVPVMDPAATADQTWPPAPAPEPEPERAELAPSVDHTSAAVRLLRSVAPWTAPTHAGSENRSDSD